MNSVWPSKLIAHQQADCLDRKEASVHVVSEEEIVCIWAGSTNFEDFKHVPELAMDVTDNRHWRADVDNVGLLHEEFFGFGTYCLDDGLGKEFLAVETFDASVEVD